MEGNIYIYGEIGWSVSAADVQSQITNNQNADSLNIHINSVGGDVYEGWAIHDIIQNSGKKVTTIVEGICASIASIIFFAGDTRLMTENSEIMIHNPSGWTGGTAEELSRYTEQLQAVEDKLVNYYASKTGIPTEEIATMMKNETFMDATTAIDKGFATGLTERIKAAAKFVLNQNKPKPNTMDENKIKALFDGLWAKLAKKFNIKNLLVADATGKNLDFGDQIETPEQIAVGMTAKWEDGTLPSGDVVLADGSTLVFDETGKITEIKPVEPATDDSEEMTALKAENENLKAEIETLKTAQNSLKSDFESKLTNIKAEMKSEFTAFIEENPEFKTQTTTTNRVAKLKESKNK